MRTAGQHQSGTETGVPFEPNTVYALHERVRKEARSQLRFNLTHMLQGEVVQQRIPGMLYAYDIVLLADNQTDMQRLGNISAQEATELGLNSIAQKKR